MTDSLVWGIASAAWLGLLTAISPCPLASNIAAVSYIGRRVGSPRAAVFTGLLYAAGRMLAYAVLAALLLGTTLSAPAVSQGLQRHMSRLLGPLLILVGMVLLGLIRLRTGGGGRTAGIGERLSGWGIWGGLPLGVVFALSFCPASAALYFAGLMPLSLKFASPVVMPLVFGAATALPVVVFAVLIVVSTQAMGTLYGRLAAVERWARGITGAAFILIGFWFCLRFIFQVV